VLAIVTFQDNVLTINKSLFKVVSINTCLVEKNSGGNTGADAPESVFKPPPSLLLLIKVSLDELFKSLRRQGGGIGDRTAETPLGRRGSPAVGRRRVVGRGSGDQNGQGQQNRNSRIKNIFFGIEIKRLPISMA
jgi:hypothetical protein